jgi:hypothetical protein
MLRNPASPSECLQHTAYETFIATVIASSGLHRPGTAPAAQCGARADLDLPAHALTAGRLQLSPPADLFGLWRRGDRALRAVGRRVDGAGAAIALSALGYLGDRQRAADTAAARAMVSAVAVRPMARRQRALKRPLETGNCCTAFKRNAHWGSRIDLMPSQQEQKQCAGKSAIAVTTPDISICWRRLHSSLPSSRHGGLSAAVLPHRVAPHSSSPARVSTGRPNPAQGTLIDNSRFDSYDRQR